MLKILKEFWLKWKNARKGKDDEPWPASQQPSHHSVLRGVLGTKCLISLWAVGVTAAEWSSTWVTLSGLILTECVTSGRLFSSLRLSFSLKNGGVVITYI